MKVRHLFSFPLVLGILAAGMAGRNATAGAPPTAFAGQWHVSGVAVSSVGVAALVNNDPSLMGRRLTFSSTRLAWDSPLSTNDTCMGPRFIRLSTPPPVDLLPQLRQLGMPRPTTFALHCESGTWGPAKHPVFFRGAGGVLALPWYDGGLLKLTRQ